MAGLSMTALADAIGVIGIALTVDRSAAGHWKDPERADDRHPAASRSALWTRVVFPEPRRAELGEVIVDLASLGRTT
jgi:hypothetical protein